MKIDKTRFLLLTTTIAASAAAAMVATSGCSTTNTNTNTDSGTTTDSGTDSTTADSSTDSGDGGATCLDDNGSAPYCGPTGEGGDPDAGDDAGDGGTADAGPNAPVCQYECGLASENLKKGIANAVNDCLNKDKDTNKCVDNTKTCVAEAAAKACDDATAKTFCEKLISQCKGDAGDTDGGIGETPFTQQNCEAVVKPLSAKGRENFTSCVTEGSPTSCVSRPGDCIDAAKILAIP